LDGQGRTADRHGQREADHEAALGHGLRGNPGECRFKHAAGPSRQAPRPSNFVVYLIGYGDVSGTDFDGSGDFFCGRAADTISSGDFIIFDAIVAGNLASFFAAMGALYEAAGYTGLIDVGMAVTGIEGAAPLGEHYWGDTKFSGPAPRRTSRVSAAELRDDAKGVTLSLIRRFLDATRGPSYTPFAA
jgi:hypothetical protein